MVVGVLGFSRDSDRLPFFSMRKPVASGTAISKLFHVLRPSAAVDLDRFDVIIQVFFLRRQPGTSRELVVIYRKTLRMGSLSWVRDRSASRSSCTTLPSNSFFHSEMRQHCFVSKSSGPDRRLLIRSMVARLHGAPARSRRSISKLMLWSVLGAAGELFQERHPNLRR